MHRHDGNPFEQIAGRLRDALLRRDDRVLGKVLPALGDDELVHTVEELPVPDRLRVFRALTVERQLRTLLESSDHVSDTILESLTFEEIWRIIGIAESDDAVDIIQWVDEAMRARLMAALRQSDPTGLLPLLVYEEETAGGRMKTEILRFGADQTVSEVRAVLQKEAMTRFKTHYLYVTETSGVLVGRISPIRFMQQEGGTRMRACMNPDIAALDVHLDQEEVVSAFDEHNAIELPVVDQRGKLLGVITADDVIEVLEEEHGEDVARMAGIGDEAHISDPVWLSARRRMPWLAVNMVTAMVAASVIGAFQGTISQLVVLAAFMPVVAGMGGNAAQQALAVTVRAIALGDMEHLRKARIIAKEVLVGALNGFLAGNIVGLVAYLVTSDPRMWLVVVGAMTANLLLAGLVGVAVPTTMKALKQDPALASTVFVTATTDIFGFAAFLGLATLVL